MTEPKPLLRFSLDLIDEVVPGERWADRFRALWPEYRRWFLARGEAARPTFLECERAVRTHLPEFADTWRRLVDLAGGGDLEARFLSLYRPPPYLTGCSQAVRSAPAPVLVRNYDYHPRLFEGIVLRSGWNGREVMAVTDCLVGVLDGINADGLAASLSFGGRRETGDGFGAPLVLRYILEFCPGVPEAIEVLRRVPTHMAYNVLLLDRSGAFATVFTGPGRAVRVRRTPFCTNHQGRIVWPHHAWATATLARENRLRSLVAGGEDEAAFIDAFLQPPLYNTDFKRGFGTLYTAVYRVRDGAMELRWPGTSCPQSFRRFQEGRHAVEIPDMRDASDPGREPPPAGT